MSNAARTLGGAIVSGLLQGLALRLPSGWALAWIALVPLLVTVEGARAPLTVAAAIAYIVTAVEVDLPRWLVPAFAAYFQLSTLEATGLAIGIPGALAAMHGGALGLALAARPRGRGVLAVLWLAALWVAWESIRTLVLPYVPAAVLGTSQRSVPALLQVASLAGIGGVTALIVAVNAAIAMLWSGGLSGRRALTLAAAVALVGAAWAWGTARLAAPPFADTGLRVVTVDADAHEASASTLERYVEATPPQVPTPALVVWPESALPIDLQRDRVAWARLARFVDELGTTLVTGGLGTALGADARVIRFNSVHLVRPRHGIVSYHKRRLVPVAESWPARLGPPPTWVDPVAAGRVAAVWDVGGVAVAPLVCFEIMDPASARELARRGADVIVNVSNDVWFQAGAPHLEWAVIRAVESGRPVVRAANAGTSALIDPTGRLLAETHPVNGPAVLVVTLPAATDTLYARTGDVVLPACLLVVVGGMLPALRRLRGSRRTRS